MTKIFITVIAAMFALTATAWAAPINTSRSNKKHGDVTAPNATGGPAKAPIVTSRSNKKHGDTVAPNTTGGPAKAPISTSRSNKKN